MRQQLEQEIHNVSDEMTLIHHARRIWNDTQHTGGVRKNECNPFDFAISQTSFTGKINPVELVI